VEWTYSATILRQGEGVYSPEYDNDSDVSARVYFETLSDSDRNVQFSVTYTFSNPLQIDSLKIVTDASHDGSLYSRVEKNGALIYTSDTTETNITDTLTNLGAVTSITAYINVGVAKNSWGIGSVEIKVNDEFILNSSGTSENQ
jgi:hypothetical protein